MKKVLSFFVSLSLLQSMFGFSLPIDAGGNLKTEADYLTNANYSYDDLKQLPSESSFDYDMLILISG